MRLIVLQATIIVFLCFSYGMIRYSIYPNISNICNIFLLSYCQNEEMHILIHFI